MVGVVVGYEQGFAEDGLAFAPGDLCEEIGLGIFHEIVHGFRVAVDLVDAFVPGVGGGRLGGFRPVSFGPFRRFVFEVAAEFEDVGLGDADVFEEHPGGVGEVGRLLSAEFWGEIFDGVFEGGVGVSAFEEFEDVLAEGSVRVFGLGHGVLSD